LLFAMWRSYIVYKIYTINPLQELKKNIIQRDSINSKVQRRKLSNIKQSNSRSSFSSNNQMALRYINDSEMSI